MKSAEERFWEKVDKNGPIPEYRPDLGPCWVWMAGKTGEGYGSFWNGRAKAPAHRFAYEFLVGTIPPSLVIDHLCRVTLCVNPAHMEVVDHTTNKLRGVGWAGQHSKATHCPEGHPYDLFNTRIRPNGQRTCRLCHLAESKKRHDAQYWRDYRAMRRAQGRPVK